MPSESSAPSWTTSTERRHQAVQHLLLDGSLEERALAHTKDEGWYVDFEEILATPLSTSEVVILRAAWSLFNGESDVSLDDVVGSLDDSNFDRVLTALKLARGVPPWAL